MINQISGFIGGDAAGYCYNDIHGLVVKMIGDFAFTDLAQGDGYGFVCRGIRVAWRAVYQFTGTFCGNNG